LIFTIGYEGLGITTFIEILKKNNVKTLLDCRYNAYSRNQNFSKKRLASLLKDEDIRYEHLREYGIPSEIRKAGNGIEWYVERVKPNIDRKIVNQFEQPVCFMCMERDLDRCHRKIILGALQEQGLDGKDLYPGRS
jgi:uncharacterized protein (DUF488 family)